MNRYDAKHFDVAVCGLGYVGLALAREACAAGLRVLGFDVDGAVVANLSANVSHIDDVDDDDLTAMAAAGFTPTGDPSALRAADAIVICVPTPLDEAGLPDLGAVRAAGGTVGAALRPGMLVVLESTSFPGTTDEVLRPLLEQASGLTAGIDFHLAHSPERIDPGNTVNTVAKTPKVVGGYTPGCTTRAAEFYGRFVHEVVRAGGTREAETAKLLENTYRHVNIALVNQLAVFCHRLGIDVWNVLHCASTKPFGFQPFHPGPGVGGHCIPVDPLYLAHTATLNGYPFTLIEAAERVNASMPQFVVQRCADLLRTYDVDPAGASVLVLGVTYKADIRDLRMSPSYPVIRGLRALGMSVTYHDPFADEWTVDGEQVAQAGDLEAALAEADLCILLQNHAMYRRELVVDHAQLLFDARGVFAGLDSDHVEVL